MIAALASIGMFLYYGFIGTAILAAVRVTWAPGQYLTAPALGCAALVLPALWLNRAGLPVEAFAPYLAIALGIAAAATIFVRKPTIPIRELWPIMLLLVVAFGLVGRPLFEFGFNWLSYANDDMANYVLGSELLARHGFYDIPDIAAYSATRDTSLFYWMFLVISNNRSGMETMLAFFISIFRVNGFGLYMPVIIAAHLMMLSSATALIYRNSTRRYVAIAFLAVLILSALNVVGTLYQLLPQVFGLGLLGAVIALTCNGFPPTGKRAAAVALPGIAGAGLAVIYPEILPYAILGVPLNLVIRALRGEFKIRGAVLWLAGSSLIVVCLLNGYLRTSVGVLVGAALAGGTRAHAFHDLFWYFLVPSGPASLFGMQSYADFPTGNWASFLVVTGFLLLALFVASTTVEAIAGEPIAGVALVMFALMPVLFMQRADYGLFKICLYIQPFIFGGPILTLARLMGSWRPAVPVLADTPC